MATHGIADKFLSRLNGTGVLVSAVVLCFLAAAGARADQFPESPPDGSPYRTDPVEPFRIADNLYFVGPNLHNASYLFTSNEGLILIDSIEPRAVPVILANIRKLGFDGKNIKYLLETHAHRDHVAGLARMKQETGAKILASKGDAEIIETGGKADFAKHSKLWPVAKVDEILRDGQQVRVGDTVITAHIVPGQTRGCTTWTSVVTDHGKAYNTVVLCGADVKGKILGTPQYPDMAEDFLHTFQVLQNLPVDIFLGAHGYWYHLGEKIKRMKAGEGTEAFVDPEGYRKAVNEWEYDFIDQLISECNKKMNR